MSPVTAHDTRELAVPAEGRLIVSIGRDRIGLRSYTTVEILPSSRGETRLRLAKGALAVRVAPRTRGQRLSVDVGDYLVTVVGTCFMVELGDRAVLTVSVTEGQVMVANSTGQVRMVRSGQRLRYDEGGRASINVLTPAVIKKVRDILQAVPGSASVRSNSVYSQPVRGDVNKGAVSSDLPNEPAKKLSAQPLRPTTRAQAGHVISASDNATIRQWLVAGDYIKAEAGLKARLKQNPRDAAAWWLLGECRRKAGKPGKAITAYRRVISTGSAAEANRSRYQAAALLQDNLGNHRMAVALLRKYLGASAKNRPLDAAARLRLGRGFLALGQTARARAMLRDLAKRYPGTAEAMRAQKLLVKKARKQP